MKKIILVCFLATFLSFSALAQGFSFGARGIFMLPLGMSIGSDVQKQLEGLNVDDLKTKMSVGGGGAIFARVNFGFAPWLGLQAEVGFLANNGGGVLGKIPNTNNLTYENSFYYNSLDVNALITFDIPVGMAFLKFGAGPNFSFPMGKGKYVKLLQGGPELTKEYEISSKFVAGIIADIGVGYKIGVGSLVGNIRYLNDFMPIKGHNEGDVTNFEYLTRRALLVYIGYEIKI